MSPIAPRRRMRQNTRMRYVPIIAFLILTGCAPLTIYHKAGVTVGGMERDARACAVSALRDVPVNTQVRRSPARYVPGRRICDAAGTCTTRRGYYIPGDIYTVDVHKPLRTGVEQQCMADQGYAPVSIPPCPDSVARAAPAGRTVVLPNLTPTSCVIRNNNGSFQIVNRG